MRAAAALTMKPPSAFLPHPPDMRWQGPEAWLDPLEQVLLRADPPSAADTAGVRRGLELVAAYAAGQDARTAGLLAGRLLGLVDLLGSGVVRPTSAVLDAMQRGIDALRQLVAAGPDTAVEADAEGLLVEIQALSGSTAAAEPGLGANVPMPPPVAAAPGREPTSPAPALPGGPAFPWAEVDALLARLGALVDAQSVLAQALRPQAGTLSAPAAQALARLDAAVRPLATATAGLRAAHGAQLPSAPDLLEVTCLRAGGRLCLVPAALVVDCAPAGQAPAPTDALDLGLWLASPAPGPATDARTPALRLTLVANDHHVCWLVDEVLFQRTVVLHRLETHFRAWPGVAGAAVLGDQGVCLVLDPATLRPADAPDGTTGPSAG